MRKNEIHGVKCLWEFQNSKFVLTESFAIDSDGYCLSIDVKLATDDRHPDSDYIEGTTDKSRAVTLWTMTSGVIMTNFSFAIDQLPPWLNYSWWSTIDDKRLMLRMLNDGYEMQLTTAAEATRILNEAE